MALLWCSSDLYAKHLAWSLMAVSTQHEIVLGVGSLISNSLCVCISWPWHQIMTIMSFKVMIYLFISVWDSQGPGNIWASKVEEWGLYIVKSNSSHLLSGLFYSSNPPCCEQFNQSLPIYKGAVPYVSVLCYFGDQVMFCPGIISWLTYTIYIVGMPSFMLSFSKNLLSAAVLDTKDTHGVWIETFEVDKLGRAH